MVVKLQAEQQVLDGERVLLFEALVAVRYLAFKSLSPFMLSTLRNHDTHSNAIKNYEKQTVFLSHVLQKSLEEWTSPLLTSFISDTEHLMQFLGLLQAQGQQATTPEQKQYAVRRMYGPCLLTMKTSNKI